MAQVGVIRTARLTLRPPAPADIPAIAAAADDLRVTRWLTVLPHPFTEDDAASFVARARAGKLGSVRAIFDADGFAGMCSLWKELGYWVAHRAWGRGYATEATGALLKSHFARSDAGPVGSSHFEGNVRSARVLTRLGFGYLPEPSRVMPLSTGAEVICHGMVLTPEQWHAMHPLVIRTERLRLDPLRPLDAASLAAFAGRAEVARQLASVPSPWDADGAARWIERSRWRGWPGFRMAVRRDGALIGVVGLAPVPDDGAPTVMYALDPDHWGQGLAAEALGAFLAHIVPRFELGAVVADHLTDNPASGRVLRKLGFVRTGEGEGRSLARPGPASTHLWRLDAGALRA